MTYSRKAAIKSLLSRCAPELNDWTVRGLAGSLKIPLAWVNEAKVCQREKLSVGYLLTLFYQAIYAFSQNRVYEAFDLYVSAGLWNSAHDLAVLELAPDAVARQDHELFRTIFSRLSGHPIDGWHLRGKVCKSNTSPVNPEFISMYRHSWIMRMLPHGYQTLEKSWTIMLSRTPRRLMSWKNLRGVYPS